MAKKIKKLIINEEEKGYSDILKNINPYKDTESNKKNYYINDNIITAVQSPDIAWHLDHEVYTKCPPWVFEFYNTVHHSSANPYYNKSNKIFANAICDERDEFNENIGKAVAAKKCDVKLESRKYREYLAMRDIFRTLAAHMEKLAGEHIEKRLAIIKDLKKYDC